MYLTICYYESPAAKPHLAFWETVLKDRIVSKQDLFGDCVLYFVKRDDKIELVICGPIAVPQKIKHILQDMNEGFVYLKSLIFGKVDKDDLEKINEMITYFKEEYKEN